MKVLMINGSARQGSNTRAALEEIQKVLSQYDIESEIFDMSTEPVRDCTSCGACSKLGRCVFDDDDVNAIIEKAKESDGFIFGTPVYYAHPSGRILSLLDRLFYAGGSAFANKPGGAVACARRAGTTASLDVLNKYFTIAGMPVVSSTYWNVIHGRKVGESVQDEEGVQTMRNLAHNMAWLLKCIELGRQNGILPLGNEKTKFTNFIR
jgi:multimeric flavodoxin WrbA